MIIMIYGCLVPYSDFVIVSQPVFGATDYYGYFWEVWLKYGPWAGRILKFKERRIMGGSGYDLPDMGRTGSLKAYP